MVLQKHQVRRASSFILKHPDGTQSVVEAYAGDIFQPTIRTTHLKQQKKKNILRQPISINQALEDHLNKSIQLKKAPQQVRVYEINKQFNKRSISQESRRSTQQSSLQVTKKEEDQSQVVVLQNKGLNCTLQFTQDHQLRWNTDQWDKYIDNEIPYRIPKCQVTYDELLVKFSSALLVLINEKLNRKDSFRECKEFVKDKKQVKRPSLILNENNLPQIKNSSQIPIISQKPRKSTF